MSSEIDEQPINILWHTERTDEDQLFCDPPTCHRLPTFAPSRTISTFIKRQLARLPTRNEIRREAILGMLGAALTDCRAAHSRWIWRVALAAGRSAQFLSHSATFGNADMSMRAGRAQARMLATLRSATVNCPPSRWAVRASTP